MLGVKPFNTTNHRTTYSTLNVFVDDGEEEVNSMDRHKRRPEDPAFTIIIIYKRKEDGDFNPNKNAPHNNCGGRGFGILGKGFGVPG